MDNLITIYRLELQKIWMKKSVWIALTVSVIFILLVGLTSLSSDGHIPYIREQEAVLNGLSGSKMDEAFFQSFRDCVNRELNDNADRYAALMAYDPGAAFMNGAGAIGQEALYDAIYNVVRDRTKVESITAEEYYRLMRANIESDGRDLGCSTEEINTWLDQFDAIEKPVEYAYTLGYSNILDSLFLAGWILYLIISVSLSGVFADEKTFRTDALQLSARKGRTPLCLAKTAAGITTALLQTAFVLGSFVGMMFAFYGARGGWSRIQNVIPSSPWNITVAQMLLIYLGLALAAGILYAVTNMALSHLTHSSTATLAVHAALLFAGLFNIPAKSGASVLCRLWQLRPTMALHYGTFCNTFLYGKWNNVQVMVVGCLLLSILLLFALFRSCRYSQVESR